jgi:hypothetical protein
MVKQTETANAENTIVQSIWSSGTVDAKEPTMTGIIPATKVLGRKASAHALMLLDFVLVCVI